ncbi:MAG: ATP synthase subunit I [Maioricimonas sp. JB045]|uniref:ATP synthase subunit I n=1 Tax=Maioricimonas sp. JC845 TaxID=3232138 RepID=UPI00345A6104
MNDISALQLVAALAGGFALGLVFFGGLWWTVGRLAASRHPALLVAGSFLVRMAIAVGGLYLLMGSDWQRAVAGLAGFLAARWVILRRFAVSPKQSVSPDPTGSPNAAETGPHRLPAGSVTAP